MAAYSADSERIAAGLGSHTPDGPCNAECGCVSEPMTCTLDATELPGRLHDWRDVMDDVTARTPLAGGIRLGLDAATPLGRVAELIRAEHACCSFLEFAVTVDGRGSALEVRNPAEGLALFD